MKGNNKTEKYQRIVLLIAIMVIAIPIIILSIVDVSPHKLTIEDGVAKVGVKSFKVKDIKEVELLDDIEIYGRKKGTGTFTYIRGVCKVKGENQDANVYIYKNKSPYIKINLEDGLFIYNDKDSNDTKKTYENLVDVISKNE